jgi:hypothetical protein
MMRLRRASALVTLFVLTSAATAYAECAWVLWVEESNHWSIARVTPTAFAKKADCDRAASEENDRQFKLFVEQRKTAKGGTSRAPVTCLPDTVGPWGAKGK